MIDCDIDNATLYIITKLCNQVDVCNYLSHNNCERVRMSTVGSLRTAGIVM